MDTAREKVAKALGTEAKKSILPAAAPKPTTGPFGERRSSGKKGKHIITTAIEHHAVLHMQGLEKHGYEVTYLPVDEYGRVTADQLRGAIREDTILVSIMAANNEIGTILPIKELCAIAHEKGVLFHTDAVQAVGHIPLDVKELDVDMLSVSAHKFRGPKGIGALYVRRGLSLPPLLTGGGQESGRRSGTENVAGACGMAAALEEYMEHMDENVKKVSAMRDRLIEGLLKIPYSRLTGDPVNRLPGTASFVFEFIEGESMILSLDAAGICASSGSACSSGSLDPSHVLTAIGLPHEVAHGSLRLSINECNTEEDIDYILQTLPPIIQRLRDMSPLWEDYIKKFKA